MHSEIVLPNVLTVDRQLVVDSPHTPHPFPDLPPFGLESIPSLESYAVCLPSLNLA